MTPAPKMTFTCADCGGTDLELNGWVEVGIMCAFNRKINAEAGVLPLEIQYAHLNLEDTLLMCPQCKFGARVVCRNEATQAYIELDVQQLRALLPKTVEANRFRLDGWNAGIVWPDIALALAAQFPELRG